MPKKVEESSISFKVDSQLHTSYRTILSSNNLQIKSDLIAYMESVVKKHAKPASKK